MTFKYEYLEQEQIQKEYEQDMTQNIISRNWWQRLHWGWKILILGLFLRFIMVIIMQFT